MERRIRCWNTSNPLYIKYHDEEWGVPVHNDNKLFEFLSLEGFQAGLSWEIVLNKREAFRKCFDNFNPKKIVLYSDKKINELMKDTRIIRNRAKITATLHNANLIIAIQNEFGSFNQYIWNFVKKYQLKKAFNNFSEVPTESEESRTMSRELKKRGFKFVGPTTCYAFMQAVGMVNDHLINCFRYNQIEKLTQS